jgi:hypothetical protein
MKVSKWAKYIFAGVVVILLGYFFLNNYNKLNEGLSETYPANCKPKNAKKVRGKEAPCSQDCANGYVYNYKSGSKTKSPDSVICLA